MEPKERLAVALDLPDLSAARAHMERLQGEVGLFKVGLELFTAAGPDAVRAVHDTGAACFLDLKLHDIPATVGRAVEAAVRQNVRYLTLHAAAGSDALAAAASAARGSDTHLIAVTVLTSLDAAALDAIGMAGPANHAALRLGRLARQAGVDGLVTSAHECPSLRRELGPQPLLVVPGVRPPETDRGDQRRVTTPDQAVRAGADLLVVGRPIRDAADPVAVARAIRGAIAAEAG
jgi:orotidine-5'-phosphate decarboxylase